MSFQAAKRFSPSRRSRLETLEDRNLLAADLVISEILARNDGGLLDGDGSASDWIEIYNPTDSAVGLAGWSLTDDADDLDKWQIPDLNAPTIEPGEFLVIFASGQDIDNYIDGAGNLHANFSLDASGEYVALVAPDGTTIASEFGFDGANYPAQFENISYGLAQSTTLTPLVSEGALGSLLIPDSSAIGSSWTGDGPFDESEWTTVMAGVGFDAVEPVEATVLGVDFGSSTNSGSGPGGTQPGYQAVEHTGTSAVTMSLPSELGVGGAVEVSLVGNTHWRDYAAATGQYASRSALLSDGPLCNTNCTMTLTFEGLIDGNYQLTTYHHTTQFGPSVRPPATPFDIVLTDAVHSSDTIVTGAQMSDNSSDALATQTIEFVVADGNAVVVDFVRGSSNGSGDHFALPGFDLAMTATPSLGGLIQTDIGDAMQDVNASAYLRFPFEVPEATQFDFLSLQMQYDDGFVAYLNGTEVARRFAPGGAGDPPPHDAQATTENTASSSAIDETINLTAVQSLLRPGETNILAIHGLNIDAADDDFLIRPQLIAINISGDVPMYFDTPSPGAANTDGFEGFVSDTVFSVDRGVFNTAADAFDVEITTETVDATIVFTIDGNAPLANESGRVLNGILYTGPISIDSTTTLRAMAFKSGYRSTNVDTQTYLFLDDVLDQSSTPPAGYPSTWGGTFTDWGMDQNTEDLKAIAGDSNLTLGEAREVIKESLRSLPTMSIVLDIDDFFGASDGIYANTQGRGDAWERAASVELIYPNGEMSNFQIDAGIRVQGFTSRDPNRNPKHSLRLVFRKEYGAGKLNYPLFGEGAADEFDTIVLRSNSQDAWVYDTASNRQGTFVRDQWARETQLAMGQASPHGTWVHLYINGLYWGVYNPTERPDSSFNESYFGGDKEVYDSLKNHEEVIDGTGAAYQELLALIQNDASNFSAGYQDFSSGAAYQRVQGNNADGTPNPDYPDYIDVPSLIDYVIHNMYAAAGDWPGNNYIGRDRTDGSEGFRFFDWDNEHGMKSSVSTDRTAPHSRDADSPTKFHHALSSNADYRMLFADRLQRAFFNGGVLYVDPDNPQWDPAHPQRNVPAARWMKISGEIEEALIAEAARWGDVRGIQYTPNNQYASLQNDLLTNWFPQRSAIVLEQFQSRGLYPSLAAASFLVEGVPQHGGLVAGGNELTLREPSGRGVKTYYTLDGSDPRLPGGAVSPTAIEYDGSPIVLAEATRLRVRVNQVRTWSALNEAFFIVNEPASAGNLTVSEFNYHPSDPTAAELAGGFDDADRFEFIELLNKGDIPISLAGVTFADGVEFEFNDAVIKTLDAGERLVLVSDSAAFEDRYGDSVTVAGEYVGRLSNGGERLILTGLNGRAIFDFEYDDNNGWPERADGDGSSLELVAADGALGDSSAWRSSFEVGGSPGTVSDVRPAGVVSVSSAAAGGAIHSIRLSVAKSKLLITVACWAGQASIRFTSSSMGIHLRRSRQTIWPFLACELPIT